VGAIQRQFHHLVRIVPGSGRIIWNAADTLLRETLAMGCWTPLEGFARAPQPQALWSAQPAPGAADYSHFEVFEGGRPRGTVHWPLLGAHNKENALARSPPPSAVLMAAGAGGAA
jgi:UDP-N-acetylmuramate: L-alanyl-gamma-D-glutamyl-meso-diaminopimelate ligase